MPIFEDLAPGGFSYGGLYVVVFDSDSLWYETSLTIAALALKQGTKVEYHIFAHFPHEAIEAFSRLGVDAAKLQEEGLLKIIDSYTQTMEYEDEKKKESHRIVKTEDKPLDLSKSADNWAAEARRGYSDSAKRWLHIDDNTTILLQYNDEKIVANKWRTGILPYSVRARETPHLLAFAKGVASPWFYSQFEGLADGLIDLTLREEAGQVANYIRIRTLRGKNFDSTWHMLRVESNGNVILENLPSEESRRLAAIMFTDMVGYTAMTQRNESLAVELLEEHRNLLRPVFRKHMGVEINTIGDAFLVEFSSALDAVNCAMKIQSMLQELNAGRPDERKIQLRIGIHLGDVIHKGNQVSGDAVNVASRIEPLAASGGVCITAQVYYSVFNKVECSFESLGNPQLKNVITPVEVFKVVGLGSLQKKTESTNFTKE